jgi:hypothetical protein
MWPALPSLGSCWDGLPCNPVRACHSIEFVPWKAWPWHLGVWLVEGEVRIAMTDVPPAVAGVVGDWQAGGRPGQQGIRWPRERWLAAFPETALPVRLDRGAVVAACAGAAGSPAAAWQAFVVVMAWGYGTVGYGAWRTARILRGDCHAPDRLASVAQQLGERGALVPMVCLVGPAGCGSLGRPSGPSICTSARSLRLARGR